MEESWRGRVQVRKLRVHCSSESTNRQIDESTNSLSRFLIPNLIALNILAAVNDLRPDVIRTARGQNVLNAIKTLAGILHVLQISTAIQLQMYRGRFVSSWCEAIFSSCFPCPAKAGFRVLPWSLSPAAQADSTTENTETRIRATRKAVLKNALRIIQPISLSLFQREGWPWRTRRACRRESLHDLPISTAIQL